MGTSLLVNNAEVYFDFYPISFLGIRFGHYQDIRSTKFPGIDCIVYACKSRLQSNKIKANFATGYRSLFLLADYQLDFWSNSTQDRNFVEEQSMLPAGDSQDRSHDTLKTLTLTMGYRITETLRIGFTHTHQAMQKSKTYANNSILHYSQSNGDTTYIVGAGHHDSPFFQSGPLLLGMVRWTLFPSISLF